MWFPLYCALHLPCIYFIFIVYIHLHTLCLSICINIRISCIHVQCLSASINDVSELFQMLLQLDLHTIIIYTIRHMNQSSSIYGISPFLRIMHLGYIIGTYIKIKNCYNCGIAGENQPSGAKTQT